VGGERSRRWGKERDDGGGGKTTTKWQNPLWGSTDGEGAFFCVGGPHGDSTQFPWLRIRIDPGKKEGPLRLDRRKICGKGATVLAQMDTTSALTSPPGVGFLEGGEERGASPGQLEKGHNSSEKKRKGRNVH